MKYRAHDYQRYAIDFIVCHPIAAVILDMGLGKTSITLSAIVELMFNRFEVSKVLVVAPLRVARNTWSDEIGKWDHLGILRYSIVVGTKKERLKALEADADIYITNRENLDWLVNDSDVPFIWDMCVIDELSSFKNWNSQRFRAFMKVRPFMRRVVGLTGTPSSNGLMDLFAEYKMLDMGERLGWYITQYRQKYFRPEKSNGYVVYSYQPLPGAESEIYERISDITISMKAMDHLEMPELIRSTYPVHLSESEKSKYEELAKEMILPYLEDDDITAANAAALSGKLCQMANGCVYSDNGDSVVIHDRKLDALEDLIEAANGEPLMVVYWFRHDLSRIAERLDKIGVTFERIDSDESVRRWNEGEIPVALIHPASAGHGLNLQAGGSTIIWFGLTWSLELYEQTNARLWRQGQTSRTVVVEHIVAVETIDERILKALEHKEASQDALIDAVRASI